MSWCHSDKQRTLLLCFVSFSFTAMQIKTQPGRFNMMCFRFHQSGSQCPLSFYYHIKKSPVYLCTLYYALSSSPMTLAGKLNFFKRRKAFSAHFTEQEQILTGTSTSTTPEVLFYRCRSLSKHTFGQTNLFINNKNQSAKK